MPRRRSVCGVARVLLLLVVLQPQRRHPNGADAFPTVRTLIPNGHRVHYNGQLWPAVGHADRLGGPGLNPFGRAFRDSLFTWDNVSCNADSDDDGYSNGEELGDPSCAFTAGADPARFYDVWTTVSHPGMNDSVPVPPPAATTAAFEAFIVGSRNLTTAFGSMTADSFWSWRAASGEPSCRYTSVGRLACDLSFQWASAVTATPATITTGTVNASAPMTTTLAPAPSSSSSSTAPATTTAPRSNLAGSTLVMAAWPRGLEHVSLAHQQLGGLLNLSALTDLPVRHVDLRNNTLTGSFDATLLPRTLEVLDLSDNALSGVLNLTGVTLPEGLRVLELGGNSFSSVALGFRGGAASLQVNVPSAAGVVVSFTCGASGGPSFGFVNASGQLEIVPTGGTPLSCQSCVPGVTYDVAQSPCVALSTMAANNPAGFSTATVSVRYAGDVANYCDSGCTAVFVLLLIFLVAVCAFIVVFKFVVKIDVGSQGEAGAAASGPKSAAPPPPPTAATEPYGNGNDDDDASDGYDGDVEEQEEARSTTSAAPTANAAPPAYETTTTTTSTYGAQQQQQQHQRRSSSAAAAAY